jgi:UDP-N-acetylglucosamine transferase subunit ALG13
VVPEICAPGAEILWQTGWTEVGDLGIEGRQSVPGAELRSAIQSADLVIAHAGVGTALTTLEYGKCPVLLPRRRSRGEHTDDHQELIAAELGRRGLSVACEADQITPGLLLRAAALRAAPVAEPEPFLLQVD